jgi:hypothetical protein
VNHNVKAVVAVELKEDVVIDQSELFKWFVKLVELFKSSESCLNVHEVVCRCLNMFRHVHKACQVFPLQAHNA